MEVKDEIEDEEMELEDLVDKKMDSVDLTSLEKIFGLACHCLNDKKLKRPGMGEVMDLLYKITTSKQLEATHVAGLSKPTSQKGLRSHLYFIVPLHTQHFSLWIVNKQMFSRMLKCMQAPYSYLLS